MRTRDGVLWAMRTLGLDVRGRGILKHERVCLEVTVCWLNIVYFLRVVSLDGRSRLGSRRCWNCLPVPVVLGANCMKISAKNNSIS